MITESRLKNGTLTFGTTPEDFSCQASNVRVTPSYEDDGDRTETLCGDVIAPGKIGSYVLAGTVIQDFDDPAGFIAYCWNNETQAVQFSWKPNDLTTGPTIAGQCIIVALEEGGDVNTRLTTDFEFECQGKPTQTWGVAQTQQPATAAV